MEDTEKEVVLVNQNGNPIDSTLEITTFSFKNYKKLDFYRIFLHMMIKVKSLKEQFQDVEITKLVI